jgi:hypothetical protein
VLKVPWVLTGQQELRGPPAPRVPVESTGTRERLDLQDLGGCLAQLAQRGRPARPARPMVLLALRGQQAQPAKMGLPDFKAQLGLALTGKMERRAIPLDHPAH